jgi:hypothetical protein
VVLGMVLQFLLLRWLIILAADRVEGDMSAQFDIDWVDRGRPPRQPPNPHYPDGCHVNLTGSGPPKLPHPELPEPPEGEPACRAELPYPSGYANVGTWLVHCRRCGLNVAITAASRFDDARSVLLPCIKGQARAGRAARRLDARVGFYDAGAGR